MKSFIYYFSLGTVATVLHTYICNQFQIDIEFKYYTLGIMVGYFVCAAPNRERMKACNKLILEIKEIIPKLK